MEQMQENHAQYLLRVTLEALEAHRDYSRASDNVRGAFDSGRPVFLGDGRRNG
jgi:hypothetical protein